MRKKDETFSKFVEFKALVEKETSKKVKALRSDDGDDYVSNEFLKKLCKRRHSTGVDSTPQPSAEWGG